MLRIELKQHGSVVLAIKLLAPVPGFLMLRGWPVMRR